MPRIQGANQSQVLQVSNPTGFQSSGNARVEGEAIADFGSSLTKAGGALDTYLAAHNKSDEELYNKEAKIKAMNASLAVRGRIRTLPPEERISAFEKQFKEEMKPFMEKGASRGQMAEVDMVGALSMDGLYKDTVSDAVEITKIKMETVHNEMLNNVELDPSIGNTIAQIKDTNDILDKNMTLDPLERATLRKQRTYALANAAIDSQIRKGNWNDAIRTTNEFKGFIPDHDKVLFKVVTAQNNARRLANEIANNPEMTPQQRALKVRSKTDKFFARDIKLSDDSINKIYPKGSNDMSQYFGGGADLNSLIKAEMTNIIAANPTKEVVREAMVKAILKFDPQQDISKFMVQGITDKNLEHDTEEGMVQTAIHLKEKQDAAKTIESKEFYARQILVIEEKLRQKAINSLVTPPTAPAKGTK